MEYMAASLRAVFGEHLDHLIDMLRRICFGSFQALPVCFKINALIGDQSLCRVIAAECTKGLTEGCIIQCLLNFLL